MIESKQPRVLTIAGSDSSGGAGIQADIKTITVLGGYAASAITAITAQNTSGVDKIFPVPAPVVSAQIAAVLEDIGADAIKIGSLFSSPLGELTNLCQSITQGGIPCVISKDVQKDIWAKILYNCALNPLGAILDVPYGALKENGYSRELMDDIIRETFSVMQKAGYQTHWATADAYLRIFHEKLIPSTAKHRSSTLQDLEAKKKTEIDALNGTVIALADQYGIDVPTNRSLYKIIKFIEERNLSED